MNREAHLAPASGSGEPLPLRADMVYVGSSEDCDIVVHDRTVSRRHAIFQKVEGSWFVDDTASTNGTWINGRRITGSTPVTSGDHVSLGTARFFFQDGKQPTEFGKVADTTRSDGGLRDKLMALAPYDFEKLIGELFKRMGFEVMVTVQSSDGGVDVEAENNSIVYRGKYLIQCKRYRVTNKVSRPEIQHFLGAITHKGGARGIFVTSSSFTRGAREFAEEMGINLIDGDALERLVQRHHLL